MLLEAIDGNVGLVERLCDHGEQRVLVESVEEGAWLRVEHLRTSTDESWMRA